MMRGTKSNNAVELERRKFIKSAIIGTAISAATLGAGGNAAAQPQNSGMKQRKAPDDEKYFGQREVIADPNRKANPNEKKALLRVRGNLYRYTVGEGRTLKAGLVLVTRDGIILSDPIRYSGAIWLRDELRRKFNQPVKYVINSHAHYDHIGGSEIFQSEGAKVVAHEKALEPIVGEKLPTAVPDITFKGTEYKLELGGETVMLHRVASCHSNSMINIFLPRHRVMHATDYCPVNALPYNDFVDFYYDGWMENLEWVNRQDFDILEGGHYEQGTKANVTLNIEYMRSLHDQVLNLLRQGQTWDQLYRNVRMDDKFKNWIGVQDMWFPNIVGMHRWISNHRRGVW